MLKPGSIPAAEALRLVDLIAPAPHGIASRVLAKTAGGSVTVFAFDAGEGLSEHTAPFDALVIVLDGSLSLTIGGQTCLPSPRPSSACLPTFPMPLTLRRRRACC